MHRVQRKANFQCFKYDSVIPGPYSALTRHFRTQYGFKTGGKEINSELCCGQNGCRQKVNSFANFYHHLSVCEKSFYFVNVDIPNPIPITSAHTYAYTYVLIMPTLLP